MFVFDSLARNPQIGLLLCCNYLVAFFEKLAVNVVYYRRVKVGIKWPRVKHMSQETVDAALAIQDLDTGSLDRFRKLTSLDTASETPNACGINLRQYIS